MKILLLADANSVHTIKWVNALLEKGVQIIIYSLNDYNRELYPDSSYLTIECLFTNQTKLKRGSGAISKLKYLNAVPQVRKLIRFHQPDILHAHYASSYGLIGALSGFKPYIISVWGSDVFDFPKRNFLLKKVLEFNLKKADYIFSTSKRMAEETQLYTKKKIEITPFGVDLDLFKKQEEPKTSSQITIGTIKSLYPVYGIDVLIEAFYLYTTKHPEKDIILQIGGVGSGEAELKQLVSKRKLNNKVVFRGFIPQKEVPKVLSSFDIYLALSRQESFGVAVVEAMACETPVIVTNVGGLPEIVTHNYSGIVVQSEEPLEACNAIEKLLANKDITNQYVKNALSSVRERYDWKANVDLMVSLYQKVIADQKNMS